MTSKESLEYIEHLLRQRSFDYSLPKETEECIKIILKALERLEELEEENQELSQIMQLNNEYIAGFERVKTDLINGNKKLKKAIEILKKKFVFELENNKLNFLFNYSYFELTNQEYDLLKEVLGG